MDEKTLEKQEKLDKDRENNKEAEIDYVGVNIKEETKQTEDLISKANAAASRMEAANKVISELLAKQERMAVERIMGGKSNAGSQRRSKEEIGIANARKMLAGTGYDDELFPMDK